VTYTNFTVRDVAGHVHPIRLSTDPRYPVAMDGGPAGFLRRRSARDQEPGELPEQIDAEFALQCMREIADRVADPNERKTLSQGMAELIDGLTTESHNNGENPGAEYPARPGYVPAASGQTAPKFNVNARRGGMDSALAMDRKDPRLASYLSRIKTFGY
jgi:hypothetical protein